MYTIIYLDILSKVFTTFEEFVLSLNFDGEIDPAQTHTNSHRYPQFGNYNWTYWSKIALFSLVPILKG